jgi:hypothetical protein
MSNFFLILIEFKLQKNKINIFKHENKMAPEFKMDVKTFLLVKTCKFSFYLKFSLRLIKFALLSVFLKKKHFLRNSNVKILSFTHKTIFVVDNVDIWL